MKKKWTRVISALLLAGILLTFGFTALAKNSFASTKESLDLNGDGEIKYLAIGSSATAGVGIGGGYQSIPEGSYPMLVKAALENSGKKVDFSQLAIPGVRVEELRFLLDNAYSGDAYTEKEFIDKGIFDELGGVASLRTEYENAVKNAEFITLELGTESFIGYALGYIFDNKYEADFSLFDEDVRAALEDIKVILERVIAGDVPGGNEATTELLSRIVDGLTYAVVSYAVNFDAVLGRIYELNPNAVVTVTNVRNAFNALLPDLDQPIMVDDNIMGLKFSIPFVSMYGVAVDLSNIYMAKLSEYSGRFNIAFIGDDGNPTSFEDDLREYSGSITPELSAYFDELGADTDIAVDALAKIIQKGVTYKNIDLPSAANATKNVCEMLDEIIKAAHSNPIFNLDTNFDYKDILKSPGLMTRLTFAVRHNLGTVVTLPNAEGHKEIADAVISATEKSVKGTEIMENNIAEIYRGLFEDFDREALLNLGNTLSPEYVVDPVDSYYVALGDNSASGKNSYVTKLAESLGFADPDNIRYNNLANWSYTPEKLLERINDAKFRKELVKADLVTISFNNAYPTKEMFDALISAALKSNGFKRVDLDWAKYVGEENVDEIDKLAADIKGMLIEVFGNEARADMLLVAIEAYAYSYVSRLSSYPQLVDRIHEITGGDALVVILGAYNDLADTVVIFDGEELPFGTYVQYFIDIANVQTLLYAASTENTAYIDCPEVETFRETKKADITILKTIDPENLIQLKNFYWGLGDVPGSVDTRKPTDESHKNIAAALIGKISPISLHRCEYDNDCDDRCNKCGVKRDVEGHKFTFACTEKCSICGAENKNRPTHIYSAPCDSKCDVCGKERACAEHTYTGSCDVVCDPCGEKRQVEILHNFGEWKIGETEKTRVCSSCGTVERQPVNSGMDAGVIAVVAISGAAVLGVAAFFAVRFGGKKRMTNNKNKED